MILVDEAGFELLINKDYPPKFTVIHNDTYVLILKKDVISTAVLIYKCSQEKQYFIVTLRKPLFKESFYRVNKYGSTIFTKKVEPKAIRLYREIKKDLSPFIENLLMENAL